MDIPVNRIKPFLGSNSLAWSEDGDFAIVGTPNVIVYNAKDFVPGEKLEFARSEIAEPVDFEYNKEIQPFSSINHADFAPPVAIAVGWSPTGMTSSGGCFLTVLSNKHQFLLFQNIGAPSMPEWVYVADLSWNLEKSPAITCSDWTRVEDGSLWGYSLLALGTEQGLFIYKVAAGNFELLEQHLDIYDCQRVKFVESSLYIQTNSSVIIRQEDQQPQVFEFKKRVSAIHADPHGILLAHPGHVTHFPSNHTVPLQFAEGIAGFLGTSQQWAAISSKGNVHLHNNFPTELESYLQTKRKAGNLTVLGVSTAAGGSAFGISYFTRPQDGLFFPSLKFKSIVLSLHTLQAPSYSDIRIAPRAHWLLCAISKSELPHFTDIDPPEAVSTLENILVDTDLAKMRLETYFRVKDHSPAFSRLLAGLVLAPNLHESNEPLVPLDSAILVSYTKYQDAKVSCPPELEVASEQLTQTFDFNAQRYNSVIESSSKHKWKRCSTTLLPIFSMNTLSSSNNQFQILSPDSRELRDTRIGKELVSLPICLFNGCRYYHRVRA